MNPTDNTESFVDERKQILESLLRPPVIYKESKAPFDPEVTYSLLDFHQGEVPFEDDEPLPSAEDILGNPSMDGVVVDTHLERAVIIMYGDGEKSLITCVGGARKIVFLRGNLHTRQQAASRWGQ